MSRESAGYKGTKRGTKVHGGFRALVPPSLEGARAANRAIAKTKRKRVEGRELGAGEEYTAVLAYPPVSGNNAVRHVGKGRAYRTDQAQAYRLRIAAELAGHGLAGSKWKPITNLHVRLQICPPDERERDVDNMLKEFKDALTKAGFWVGDSNRVIKEWSIRWLPAATGGAIMMTVKQFTP